MSLKNSARETKSLDPLDGPVASDPRRRASGVQARAKVAPSAAPARAERAELPMISIGSPADQALLEPTYAYLSAYCFACLPPQLAERVNVAIYELYANALRYGSAGGEVRLEIDRTVSGVELRVQNHAEPAEIERITAQVAHVQRDPSAAFSGEMNRFAGASQSLPMFGIVRVAHEAGLPIELRIARDVVEISTVCTE